MRILISGGGTGGHVYPALAVAAQLKSEAEQPGFPLPARGAGQNEAVAEAVAPARADAVQSIPVELLWAGSPDGVECELVEAAGIPYRAIQTGQLRGKNPLTALANAGKMIVGVRQSLGLIDEFKPDVCFVTGGYVCTPVAIACRLRRVPVLVYLPDMTPGLAIRWLSLLATRVAVSFPEVSAYFGSKAVVTGYPVRPELLEAAADRQGARRRLAQALEIQWEEGEDGDPLPLLLVFGGSRGSLSINKAIWAALPDLLPHCQILHITGTRDWPLYQDQPPALPAHLAGRYHPVAYLHDEMALALASADLVVARAGASTLAEFPLTRLPAILVPLPIAGNHQLPNARKLADAGGAAIIEDEALARELTPLLVDLLQDELRRLKMGADMATLARPRAAFNLAQELIRLGNHA
ncbi:MAG: UDP-N-acetylglucosamine--N-acetylmuramyl-(pentapeptide) pyrophosphoryl-undecaprenol N-acetylglucosamine transferase [Caldilineaceae bacterium]|nr:UDP-N-acetylglucosamine--N-acetylmuramyl-(pentapeptide) pyrophosphoryl-undecaprenol N-acetylglucosamine transferase [Caldilineaceae bacterium]